MEKVWIEEEIVSGERGRYGEEYHGKEKGDEV